MNKKLILFFSFLINQLIAQNSFGQRVNINEIYYSIPFFQSNDVIESPDHGYVMAGANAFINGGDFIIAKTDSLGAIEWVSGGNRFDGINGDSHISSLVYYDNYYYLLGNCQPVFGHNYYLYIVKCDLIGNIIWDKIIDTAYTWGKRIRKTSDGNFIILGTKADTMGYSRPWISKMDTAGNLTSTVSLYYPLTYTVTDLISINSSFNSKMVICAMAGQYIGPILHQVSMVSCFDSTGYIYWSYTTSDTSGNGIVKLLYDSNYVYAGQFYSYNLNAPGHYKSAVLKFDTLGNLIWKKEMNSLLYHGVGYSACLAKTDHAVIAAFDGLHIVEMDTAGIERWTLEQDTFPYGLSAMIINYKNELVLTGYFKFQAGHPWYSFLVSVTDTAFTSIPEYESNILNIFPNPFVDGIYVHLLSNFNKYELNIYDISGRILFNTVLKRFQYIDLSDFEAGIYVISIKINSNIFKQKIIIKTNK